MTSIPYGDNFFRFLFLSWPEQAFCPEILKMQKLVNFLGIWINGMRILIKFKNLVGEK